MNNLEQIQELAVGEPHMVKPTQSWFLGSWTVLPPIGYVPSWSIKHNEGSWCYFNTMAAALDFICENYNE